MVNYLSKNYATNQATAEDDAVVLRYVQPSNMTRQQYANDLVARSCKAADVFNESTLNVVFIKAYDTSIRHSLRIYRTSNLQAYLTDVASLCYPYDKNRETFQQATTRRPIRPNLKLMNRGIVAL